MLKNKKFRIWLLILGLIVVGAGSFLAYYRLSRIQGIKTIEIVNPELKEAAEAAKVIVYTQDRDFKNNVLDEVKNVVESQAIYMEIQPVEDIDSDFSRWDKVIIFTTVQSSEPPQEALTVMNEHKDDEKLGIFLTADSGEWAHQPADVDAFTSASSKTNTKTFRDGILAFIK